MGCRLCQNPILEGGHRHLLYIDDIYYISTTFIIYRRHLLYIDDIYYNYIDDTIFIIYRRHLLYIDDIYYISLYIDDIYYISTTFIIYRRYLLYIDDIYYNYIDDNYYIYGLHAFGKCDVTLTASLALQRREMASRPNSSRIERALQGAVDSVLSRFRANRHSSDSDEEDLRPLRKKRFAYTSVVVACARGIIIADRFTRT